MITVKGKVENGQILALEPLDEEFEGREVQITLIESTKESEDDKSGLAELFEFVEKNSIETGIGDLAHQHDHYLYGTPKRED